MYYAISDIHGCYDLYSKMLDKIGFSDSDTLFFLGDAIDRGPDGLAVLRDLMHRPNAVCFLGNHEDMMRKVVGMLGKQITVQQMEAIRRTFINWTQFNGGEVTWDAFMALPEQEREEIVSWLENLKVGQEIAVNGNAFLLVHAGVGAYEPKKDLRDCTLDDFIWERMDYGQVYYPDKFLVTGHTPTGMIDRNSRNRIFRKNNHIAIDCGAVYGGTLGCFCLDTMEEFYVSREEAAQPPQ